MNTLALTSRTSTDLNSSELKHNTLAEWHRYGGVNAGRQTVTTPTAKHEPHTRRIRMSENMYRVQVWFEGDWRWGMHDYTRQQAEERVKQMKSAGIKCRIKPSRELFN